MADNDIKEKDQVESQPAEAVSEQKSINLVDLLGSSGHSMEHHSDFGKMGSKAESSLPSLSIADAPIGDKDTGKQLLGKKVEGKNGPTDTADGQSLVDAIRSALAADSPGKLGAKEIPGKLGSKEIPGKIVEGGKLEGKETDKTADLMGKKILEGKSDVLDRIDGKIAKQALKDVNQALSELHPKLQGAFSRLSDAKNGNYSNEQLAFLKQHAGLDAYNSANSYNDAMNRIRGRQEANREDHGRANHSSGTSGAAEGLSRPERKPVSAGESGSPAEGHDNSSRPQETQREAKPLNRAEGQREARPADGQAEAQREALDKKKISPNYGLEMKEGYAAVNKAVAQMKPALQEMFNEIPGNKNGTYSNEQLSFLKEHAGKEGYLGALQYNAASDALSRQNQNEQVREAKEDKRLAFVQAELAKLPKDLQKEFANLPMVKDGVGYSQQHVAFLEKHAGKDAAQALNNYMTERRQMMWGRKK